MSPFSSCHVWREAVSNTNVAINYNQAGCNKCCGLRNAFTHTVSNSCPVNTRAYLSCVYSAVLVCSEWLSTTQTKPLIVIWQDATSAADCALHSCIPYPLHVSLTCGGTGLGPSSSPHVHYVAVSQTNVALNYKLAGCSMRCGLSIAFTHTVSISRLADKRLHQS